MLTLNIEFLCPLGTVGKLSQIERAGRDGEFHYFSPLRGSLYGAISSWGFGISSNDKAPPLYLRHCQSVED
jgi:hypothetical protein